MSEGYSLLQIFDLDFFLFDFLYKPLSYLLSVHMNSICPEVITVTQAEAVLNFQKSSQTSI